MLSELSIKNFAIIDELHVSFSDGLNVISGETGAGKSIIIGAISLLLGDRAVSDIIRSSEDTASIEASFRISGMAYLVDKLQRMDLCSDEYLVIKRIISRSGKNKVYINGSLANLAILTSLSESLVNICGQHEHQVILNKNNHVDILDNYGGLNELKQAYGELYEKFKTLQDKFNNLERKASLSKENEELQKFQLKEIIDSSLKEGEDEALQEEKKLIIHAQKLLNYAEFAHNKLYGSQGCVLEGLKNVMVNIREIKKIDEKVPFDEKYLESVYYNLEDTAANLRNYSKSLFFDPTRLDAIEERLEMLSRLKRKYGGSIKSVLEKKISLESSLSSISSLADDRNIILRDLTETRSEMQKKAIFLSHKRRETAAKLQSAIEQEIHTLRMDRASFSVVFSNSESREEVLFSDKGIDDVEFYISTNTGEELKPLIRIASGGELSRIILAIKKVLAGKSSVGTIIFDEVDSGIGGGIANIVGETLQNVAKNYQVICITHLPQIACFADSHYRVTKYERDGRTIASISELSNEEEIDEITRMLAGAELTKKARDHAKEMLGLARAAKHNI